MKLLHTADIHLGMENYGRLDPETGLSTRLADFLRAFDLIVDRAISEPVDFFIFSGDAFKTREPTQTQQREFAKRLKKLGSAGIPVIMTVGNHDTSNALGKANSLDIYQTVEMPNIYLLRDLELIELNGLQIVAFPWLSRAEFETAHRKFQDLLTQLDPNKPAIAMAHGSVEGASFGSERLVMMGGDMVVEKSVLDHPNLCYVALGHIHKRQTVPGTKIPMVYPGSIERIDFGESKEDKGFEIVDISKKDQHWIATHQHFSTNPRPFNTIKVKIAANMTNPTTEVLNQIAKHNIKDSIVRVLIDFEPEASSDLNSTKIKEALTPAFFSSISKNISRVSRPILNTSNVETLSPQQALVEYFKSKGASPEYVEKLLKLSEGLSNDTN